MTSLPENAPPLPAWPPRLVGSIDLRVSKRLLWVGRAAYPLQNIARVHTFTLHPKRKEATVRFLKNVALTLAVAIALTVLGGATALANREASEGIISFVWWGVIAALIYFLVQLVMVLSADSHYVLAVETNGRSTAVVTSANPHHLDRLVGQISHAIENPGAEFQVTVDSITINPQSYYFGDNVNMYGGTGNVGMAS
ncbi:hypothetical protein I5Q34_11675 [Streptomyces sp. AV19]|uniref:DUF6232 family protein n=1 Tax=Streptomyces sp. AV19 TaxID=2793068 RepID=UPI0018FEF34A|nr:DUF6232 family protein [Streptomyces sp. AV19]MBH1934925.1 hypothetical protein [Streptomyces sp. AV19]MDG4534530.1 DUF6232 family protein [Streptomyces sp. AV19]